MGIVILALVIIVCPLSKLLTMIIHDIIIGKEGREAERKEAEERVKREMQIARDRIEMRKEVDEIFRRQRERIKDKD